MGLPAAGKIVRLHSLGLCVSLVLGLPITVANAADDIQFNTDVLDLNDRNNIDLSNFARGGYIMPGTYGMVVHINKNDLPEHQITFYAMEDDTNGSRACVSRALVEQLGFKESAMNNLTWWHQGECLDESSLQGMEVRGDLSTASLYLSIPQAFLEYSDDNWDPPTRWDNGIAGVLMDYYLSAQSQHEENAGDSQILTGNGTVGTNLGAWRLRADWQTNQRSGQGDNVSDWDWSRFYAYRALPSLGAKLTLGEDSLYSNIFDSFRFTGASLQSDDNMLPPNLRGYAPEVSGVAKTNAKIIISQQGRVIKETQVAAGPFRIQDLNTMVSGTLDVRVEESDGSVQDFTINTATIPYLTRPGMLRYKLASGRPSNFQHHTDGPGFATGEFSWGVNNGWSLYGGGIGSNEYDALALGIGRDLMSFGALSFDVTHSRARLPGDNDTLQGNSWRVNYSKRFDTTDSQVSFAGYRFSERDFMSMGEFLDAQNDGERESSSKELYTVTFNQRFSDWQTSAYLNYSHQTYWDRTANDRYNLTMSRFFDMGTLRNLSLSATAYHSRDDHGSDNGMYLSLSVPWGDNGTLSYNTTFNRDDKSHQLSYSDSVGERDTYQLSSGVSRQGGMASGYWMHNGDLARMYANANYQAGSYSSLSLSLQGGMTATAKGAALHRGGMTGGTRLLLDTSEISDIPVKGFGSSIRTNAFGKAVVTDVSSYYRNRISIDLDALPDDAEAAKSVVQATLTEGAIGYRQFDVVSGARAMASIRLPDGSAPPFGATIQNAKGQYTGIIGDDGSVYLSGINSGDTMQVRWGDDGKCVLKLPASLPQSLGQGLLLPCKPDSEHHVSETH
ncbi:outer membrane usher protein [Enterobacter cloacae subsp. cloacae]|uniref:outer membrane usher protein n=1 Tax=Enterobacter cloacae TaxID=550 RepID=UPI000A3B9DE8|nr:outer membrane usher protein [Enterobacter cloacae]MBW4217893.1 outer membrane usher protein [Enterobacter cloacae subsp. cloacae]OUF32411.1 hypothetical protein AZZ64_004677 [Enterobacter cloacae]